MTAAMMIPVMTIAVRLNSSSRRRPGSAWAQGAVFAGIYRRACRTGENSQVQPWIPACAGMTVIGRGGASRLPLPREDRAAVHDRALDAALHRASVERRVLRLGAERVGVDAP